MNKYISFILENILFEEENEQKDQSLNSETTPKDSTSDIEMDKDSNSESSLLSGFGDSGLGADTQQQNDSQKALETPGTPDNKNTVQAPSPPKTPEQLVLNAADEVAKKTRDVPTIFKAVKEKIQNQYSDLDKAMAIVTALKNKNSLEMKAVAQRLEQFLKAGK